MAYPKTFKIRQNYGHGSFAWSYLTVEKDTPISDLKEMASSMVRKEHEDTINTGFARNQAKPTIYVHEYDNTNHCKVKGGVEFKTKWR